MPLNRFFLLSIAVLAFVCLAGRVAQAQPANAPANPNNAAANNAAENGERYWTTKWSFEDIDVGKLARRFEAIGIQAGVDLRGTVSVRFNVGVPWTSLGDGAAYRFNGTLTSPQLVVDGVSLRNLTTSVDYRNGVATLTNLQTAVNENAGQVTATASVELLPRGDVTADVDVDQLSLDAMSDLLEKFLPAQTGLIPTAGRVTTDVQVRVPLDSVGDIASYELTGRASGRGVLVADLPPADLDVGLVRISDQLLSVEDVSLIAGADARRPEAIRLSGDASVPLDGVGELQLNLSGDDVPTGSVAALFTANTSSPLLIDGKVDFVLNGRGQLTEEMQNATWTLQGMVASPQLSVGGVDLGTLEHQVRFTQSELSLIPNRDVQSLPDAFEIKRFVSSYEIGEQAFSLSDLDALIFGGQISGSATIPTGSDGTFTADLRLDALRPTVRIGVLNGQTSELTASVTGALNWSVPIEQLAQPAEHRGTADLRLESIRIGDVDVGELQVNVAAEESEVSLTADGELFDGTVHVETVAAAEAGDLWSDAIGRLRDTEVTFDGIDLEPLSSWFLNVRSDLTGLLSGSISVDPAAGTPWSWATLPALDVDLQLQQVRYRSRLLSRSMRLASRVENGVVEVELLAGDYALGTVRTTGRVHLIDERDQFHPRADLRVTLTRVALDRGLWFLNDLANSYQGRASGAVTVAGFGEAIRVRGSVDGRDLVLYGIGLGDAHSGIRADANLVRQSWDVRFLSIRSGVGGGQVDGELVLASTRRGGSGVDLESSWRTRRVDFFRLSTQLGKPSSLAKGELTGDLVLNGKSIQSVDDLTGRFQFRLEETRGAAVPGLLGISRLLGPVSLTNQTFHEGEAKGIVGRGAVVMDEFWMASEDVLIRADGKVFLRSGRMDMEALVATGNYQDVAAQFAELASRYALRTLIPASAILDVSEMLCDRVLVVSVRGTTSNPIVRLLTVETFREETTRFLLREGQRVILYGATAGTVDGIDN